MSVVEPAKKTAEATKQPLAQPEDAKKGKDDDSFAQAGKQAPKDFGKTSIDTIKQVMPQSGLKSIDMKFFRAEYEGATIETIRRCIRTVEMDDPYVKETMAQCLERLIECSVSTYLSCEFTLDKGRGSQRRLYCAVRRSKWGAGSYDFFLQELDMKFELDPTLIIESKNFCHEKNFESVHEDPANLTAESTELLFNGLMGYLVGVCLRTHEEPGCILNGDVLIKQTVRSTRLYDTAFFDDTRTVISKSNPNSIDVRFYLNLKAVDLATISAGLSGVILATSDTDEKERLTHNLAILSEGPVRGSFCIHTEAVLVNGIESYIVCQFSQRRLFCNYRRSNKGGGLYDFFLHELDMTFELALPVIIESAFSKFICFEKYFERVSKVPADLIAESAELLVGDLACYLLGEEGYKELARKMMGQDDDASEASTQQPPVGNEDMVDTLL